MEKSVLPADTIERQTTILPAVLLDVVQNNEKHPNRSNLIEIPLSLSNSISNPSTKIYNNQSCLFVIQHHVLSA